MAATQISFAAFAQQTLCTPPVTDEAAAPVVAHEPVGGDSGECTRQPQQDICSTVQGQLMLMRAFQVAYPEYGA